MKWFKPSSLGSANYGFITKGNGDDIFVHGTNVLSDHYPLKEGDEVEFTIKPGRDGRPTAAEVRKVNSVLPANFKLPDVGRR